MTTQHNSSKESQGQKTETRDKDNNTQQGQLMACYVDTGRQTSVTHTEICFAQLRIDKKAPTDNDGETSACTSIVERGQKSVVWCAPKCLKTSRIFTVTVVRQTLF